MSHEEIMNHSRRFINALYKQYIQRACENLGVSPNDEENPAELSDNDYPEDFGKLQYISREQSKMATENPNDFMSLFGDMGMNKYDTSKILTDKS